MPSRTRTAAMLIAFSGLTLGAPVAAAHAADPVPVTAATPVVSDQTCGIGQDTVLIPETEGVTYSFTAERERVILPEGVELPGALVALASTGSEGDPFAIWDDEVSVTLDVTADEGYVLATGTPTTVVVTVDATGCPQVEQPSVEVRSDECESLTLTNPSSSEVTVTLDDWSSWEPTGYVEETLAPGATSTLTMVEGEYEWFGVDSRAASPWLTGDLEEGELESSATGTDLTKKSVESALKKLPRALGGRVADPDDYVITDQELQLISELGVIIDGFESGEFFFGEGMVYVEFCDDTTSEPTPPVTPVDVDGAPGTVDPADEAPRVPAVVQTDGGSLDRSPVGGLVLVGGLLLGAGAVVRRVVRG
ncbi:hypothetical protein [Janibacter melonis]|uniref:hypothetical protein n=1 Tax=Janibacter melonis TaxID=262209 RepID=UPI00174A2650|nr:hypothetical protein [Janibacter melonis]